MKITLIGASGFVGTRLITLLKKAQRYEMLNIDLQQSRFFPEVTVFFPNKQHTTKWHPCFL